MGSFGPTQLIVLLATAAVCGFLASSAVRRKKRRARGYLFVGFCCGLLAGGVLRRRRRGMSALRAIMRWNDFGPLRTLVSGVGSHFGARTASFAAPRGRLGSWPPLR
jgi:hypothetical protein